jgi:hypothetical protein
MFRARFWTYRQAVAWICYGCAENLDKFAVPVRRHWAPGPYEDKSESERRRFKSTAIKARAFEQSETKLRQTIERGEITSAVDADGHPIDPASVSDNRKSQFESSIIKALWPSKCSYFIDTHPAVHTSTHEILGDGDASGQRRGPNPVRMVAVEQNLDGMRSGGLTEEKLSKIEQTPVGRPPKVGIAVEQDLDGMLRSGRLTEEKLLKIELRRRGSAPADTSEFTNLGLAKKLGVAPSTLKKILKKRRARLAAN